MSDLDELKQEVQELKSLTHDTNRIVHKLRRNIWWGRIYSIIWWVLVFGLSAGAYYYYAQPYVDKIQQAYANLQHGATQAQSWEQQFQNAISKYLGGQSSTSGQ